MLAARENTALPLFVTMTLSIRRTFTGCSISAMAAVIDGLDVDAWASTAPWAGGDLPMARELCA